METSNNPIEPACWAWPVTTPPLPGYLQRLLKTDVATGSLLLDLWQAGRCAICGTVQGDHVLDHDHKTALVRGYLCRGCNVREGSWTWRTDAASVYGLYRTKNPATIMGVEERYYSSFTGEAEPEPDIPWDKWKNNPMRNSGL